MSYDSKFSALRKSHAILLDCGVGNRLTRLSCATFRLNVDGTTRTSFMAWKNRRDRSQENTALTCNASEGPLCLVRHA